MAEKKVTKNDGEKKTPLKRVVKKDAPKKAEPKKAAVKKADSFAVIATGGKQYIVREGDALNVEKLDGEHKEGAKIEFTKVLLVDDGKTTTVGDPTISGVKVTAEFAENARERKISVIRFRSKSRYFKNRGHRQPYTRVKITKIG
ncbi:50S ribosomal protein L21 [bacterium]|nr:50S ribosomal protein L21 [bacterium]|tara:strand:- start:10357 stop:10791 length:435 start_codon:yes stop_codon:yes gene_type:complete